MGRRQLLPVGQYRVKFTLMIAFKNTIARTVAPITGATEVAAHLEPAWRETNLIARAAREDQHRKPGLTGGLRHTRPVDSCI